MKITCFNDLVKEAKTRRSVIAVVCAEERHTLEAILHAKREGISDAILTGNASVIRATIAENGDDPASFEIIDTTEKEDALAVAIDAIKSGRADTLMKGGIETGDFLRTVLSRDNGLRGNGLLSAVGLYETKSYHKLFAVTDFAMNISPTLDEKKLIIESAAKLLQILGIDTPKIAVLSETERLNPKIPASVDAAELKRLWKSGWLSDCMIEGPIAFDLAMEKSAAETKGFDSPVAGDADLLIVPDIVSGNIFVKSLTTMAGAVTAGMVLGAKIPVILSSRSATGDDKYYSIALAAASAHAYRT